MINRYLQSGAKHMSGLVQKRRIWIKRSIFSEHPKARLRIIPPGAAGMGIQARSSFL
jgi:hypothetical protein